MVEIATLLDRLNGELEALCAELLPGGRKIGSEYRAAGLAGGRGGGKHGGSLAVELRGAKRGIWADFASNERGDVLDLVAGALGVSKKEAIEWAKARYGFESSSSSRPSYPRNYGKPRDSGTARPAPDQSLEFRISTARSIWRQAVPIAGTQGEAYFRARGIELELPPSLRYVPSLAHKPSGRAFPAVLGAVQAPPPAREICGIWRIYLDELLPKKADVDPAKMGLGRAGRCAVRLARVFRELGVAEGIETALAVMQWRPGLPMWAALSAGGLAGLELPPDLERLWIFADNDEAGLKAARDLRLRANRAGLEVELVTADTDADFNDLLKKQDAPGER